MIDAEKQLREHQTQLDVDGVMVGVSRQALDEVLARIAELEARELGWIQTLSTMQAERDRLETAIGCAMSQLRIDEDDAAYDTLEAALLREE